MQGAGRGEGLRRAVGRDRAGGLIFAEGGLAVAVLFAGADEHEACPEAQAGGGQLGVGAQQGALKEGDQRLVAAVVDGAGEVEDEGGALGLDERGQRAGLAQVEVSGTSG